MNISSNFEQIVNPSTQQAIENACANIGGIDSVMLTWANENSDNDPIYDVHNADGNEEYLFSIDTDADAIYNK